jgi:hypothetical protein
MIKFLIAIILCLPFYAKAQTLVTGTITNAFNTNAEGKADAGAKIYLLKYEGDVINLYTTITTFLNAKNLRTLNSDVSRLISLYKDSASEIKRQKKYEAKYIGYQNIIAKIKSDETDRLATLQTINAETNEKYDALDKTTAKAISQAKLKAFDMRLLTDAGGNFSIKNKPAGQYMILCISSGRTGFSTTEASGKIFVKLLDAKEGETVNVTNKFIPD